MKNSNLKKISIFVFLVIALCVILFGQFLGKEKGFATEKTGEDVIEIKEDKNALDTQKLENNTQTNDLARNTKLQTKNNNIIEIRSKAKKEFDADCAYLSVQVDTLDLDKAVSNNKNRDIVNKIVDSLEKIGIGKDNIEIGYSNNYLTREGFINNLCGTRTCTNLNIYIDNLENLYEIIDIIQENGGKTNSINYKLKEYDAKYDEVLSMAIEKSMQKAQKLLNKTEINLIKLKEDYVYSCETKYQNYYDGISKDLLKAKISIEAQVEIIAF